MKRNFETKNHDLYYNSALYKIEWNGHEIDSFIIASGLNGGLAFDDKSRIMKKILKGLVPMGCQTESLRFN